MKAYNENVLQNLFDMYWSMFLLNAIHVQYMGEHHKRVLCITSTCYMRL